MTKPKQTYQLDESVLLDLAITAMRNHYSGAEKQFDKAVTRYILDQRKQKRNGSVPRLAQSK